MHLLYEASQDCKTKQVELEQAEKQLAKYVKEQGLEEPQYAGFERTLTFIEEMQHTAYDLSTLTVSKFISLENKYRDMVTAAELKAQIN